MYSGSGYNDWEIGDVDVFIKDGVYHLFHLIIPNHDYIAHAISYDGISWKRTQNALFVGHPGEWDDDMLWTMHVSEVEGKFQMFYTGLRRKDRGVIQKIGLAESKDLLLWNKLKSLNLPLQSDGPHYESVENNPRGWLSFRDPFRFVDQGEEYLLICARSSYGPTSRRGCVGLARLSQGQFTLCEPLVFPMVYDDIECPCVFELKGRYYLIGSIREDIKVRYWFAPSFLGEYHSFRADVLLPQGNYAARIVKDGSHYLVYNFYFKDGDVNSLRVLPPPKELDATSDGHLRLKSYYRWRQMVQASTSQGTITEVRKLLGNPSAEMRLDANKWLLNSRSGYEIFTFTKLSDCFIWEGDLTVQGMGKFGLVTDIDEDGNGYFISFDISNGLAQIRAWGFNPNNNHHNFVFNNIQSNIFKTIAPNTFRFSLIRYGNYIELSVDGVIILTLMDYTYSGNQVGIYSASSSIEISNFEWNELSSVATEYASQEEALSKEAEV